MGFACAGYGALLFLETTAPIVLVQVEAKENDHRSLQLQSLHSYTGSPVCATIDLTDSTQCQITHDVLNYSVVWMFT